MKKIISLIFTVLFIFGGLSTILAQGSQSISTFYLTRHAEKATDGTKDPPLNEKGIARAKKLAVMLSGVTFTAIYATPYKRTHQTVRPLVMAQNLEIIEYKPSEIDIFKSLHRQNPGGNYLVAGHSNSTPALANFLLGNEKYSQLQESEYDKLFVVTMAADGAAKVVILKY